MLQESRLPTVEAPRPLVPGVEHFASGTWVVQPGREEDFVTKWSQFLAWTRAEAPGLRGAMLIRDAADDRHFISMAGWDSLEQLQAWRELPGFAEMMGACRALCDDFRGSNYELTATA